jgi:phenylacetate-CoA ligase
VLTRLEGRMAAPHGSRVEWCSDEGVPVDDFDVTRRAWLEAVHIVADGCRARLSANAGELADSQTERLHSLLTRAVDHSPWHGDRLAGIDVDAITSADLSTLPTMTKADLMANWDRVVTDPDLTLEVAQRHLKHLDRTEQFSFCLDRHVVVASGGSTGQRGVFAIDRKGFAAWVAANLAHMVARQHLMGVAAPAARPVQARITARAPTHGSTAMSAIVTGGIVDTVEVPAVMPIPEMVTRLNELRPDALMSYPSALHRLAVEALEGNLRIEPTSVACGGEPLLPETSELAKMAFGVPVRNIYAASEGYIGESALPGHVVLHLGDTLIIELVDEANQPVAPGERSAKLLLTNLHNHLQPLIRYELTDEVTEHLGPPPVPWSGRWIDPPLGRMDDWFVYTSAQIHPHLFRSRLLGEDAIVEYQVLQTEHGATVRVVATSALRSEQLAHQIETDLASHGLDRPRVTIETVGAIDRHAGTGKLKRFVPLGAAPPDQKLI